MYSLTARFNQIVFFTSCTLATLSLLNQLTAWYLMNEQPSANLTIHSTEKFHFIKANHYNGGKTNWDQASFRFSLEADLKPVFTWNLKQLFLFINVRYNAPQTSECVIYDKIISRPDDPSEWEKASNLALKNQRIEYPLKDSYASLKNQTVTFEVWIEVMPYVGFITKQRIGEFPYKMPEVYS
ncbi:hypothetical protein pb186bvf_010924 [Paramecium bursaria]